MGGCIAEFHILLEVQQTRFLRTTVPTCCTCTHSPVGVLTLLQCWGVCCSVYVLSVINLSHIKCLNVLKMAIQMKCNISLTQVHFLRHQLH